LCIFELEPQQISKMTTPLGERSQFTRSSLRRSKRRPQGYGHSKKPIIYISILLSIHSLSAMSKS